MVKSLPMEKSRTLFAHILHTTVFRVGAYPTATVFSVNLKTCRISVYRVCLSQASINRKRLISHSAWCSITLVLYNLFCATETSETTTRPIYLLHVWHLVRSCIFQSGRRRHRSTNCPTYVIICFAPM